MKHLTMVSIFIMIMILTACSNEEVNNYEYTFIGEGESWEAEYLYEGTEVWGEEEGVITYSNEDSYVFTITFKGSKEEFQSIEKLAFSYDARAGNGSKVMEFKEPPNDIMFTMSGGSTGAKVQEDEIIKVIVNWDDFEESFELINQEKY
ncbi:hypothetical protein [Alkalihalobacterium chitinilyticum]|uniref:Uncharacterized protein n=1 Tax=Alkalihalobacterium chitinilyticum TaxID=2980103 RepID=A0ABT5VFS7_9BACI|nr:hypothetical protein [Alkalihalobacterium chitinilyticum]MDE5414323.1 hypothetical protein [Alkalihalobacterium chitinilyticum]